MFNYVEERYESSALDLTISSRHGTSLSFRAPQPPSARSV
jgi:hypothetical protein